MKAFQEQSPLQHASSNRNILGLFAFVLMLLPATAQQLSSFTVVDFPGAAQTHLGGINNKGQMVGDYVDSLSFQAHGFLLFENTFTSVDFPGATSTILRGINNLGQAVGTYRNPGIHGLLLSNGQFSTVDFPGADGTELTGINDKGQIVGFYFSPLDPPGVTRGFVLRSGTACDASLGNCATLNIPSDLASNAEGINDSGDIVGTAAKIAGGGFAQPFVIAGGIFEVIIPPAELPRSAEAFGINNLGQIVGSSSQPFLVLKGFDCVSSPQNCVIFSFATFFGDPRGINDNGQIVGIAFAADTQHGFIATIPGIVTAGCNAPVQFNLLDPVPDLLSGPSVTNDFNLLATKGRGVSGVAADGVSQLLVRLPATSVGDRFDLKVVDDQGHDSASPENDGAIANVVSPLFSSSATVFAIQTPSGPMAFALYQAPKDFPRLGGIDDGEASRKVSIHVQTPTSCGNAPVKIVRPPVIFIHGIWSDPSTWNDFQPAISDPRFSTYFVNYQSTNADGFLANAGLVVLPQVRTFIREFKNLKAVAAVQADVVAHSMGGNIARTMPLLLLYRRSGNFNQGEIHKLITLDTPHLGSDLATRLFTSGPQCTLAWRLGHKRVADAVRDLQPGSPALLALTQPVFPLPTHVFAGIANASQESGLQLPVDNWRSMLLSAACPNLLPPDGIRAVFGGSSDLIVSQSSEEAAGLGFLNTTIPFDDIPNVVHSVDPVLFRIGPDVLSRTFNFSTNQIDPASTSVPSRVIDLLNEPVTSSAFAAILP